jgi:uncharacterized protein (TIGR00297 family)
MMFYHLSATLGSRLLMNILERLLLAFFLSSIIVLLALWRGSLSRSGGLGALVVGVLTFGLGGWQWGVLLALFFVSSSLLSHFKEGEKRAVAEKFEKGHERDIGQVMANGGLGALVAFLSYLAPSPFWFLFFVGVMATVTADTWATELGTLARQAPRLITNGRQVEVGTSGGVSTLGTAVSLAGGLVIGLVAAVLQPEWPFVALAAVSALAGLTGSLFDSLLGATIQQLYYCDHCQKDTERKVHRCGQVTRPWRGYAWLNNDRVNFLSSAVGGVVAVSAWLLWFGVG